MQGGGLSSGIQGRGRRERKTSSKRSAWLRTFPSSGTPPHWDGLSQMDSPYCHTHIPASAFINTSRCQSRPSTSRLEVEQLSLRVQAPLLSVTRAAAPWAEVLSHPLSSPRINSEASGCVDLNHRGRGAGRSRGSDFPGRASGLYKLRRAGHPDLSHQLLLPERSLRSSSHSAPTMSQVGGPSTGVLVRWGVEEGVDSWTPSSLAAVS